MSIPSSAFRVDAAVIGAGVLGLATARALSVRGREVVILERDGTIGSGTSSRNSEVIHAGIYYPPASLKARLCVAGRTMLYDYCDARSVDCRRCGKLVVAADPEQAESDLPAIAGRARECGVADLRVLTAEEATEMEPELTCRGAILSPSTGIIDSHGLMVSVLADAERCGATLALRASVDGAGAVRDGGGGGGGILLRAGDAELLCDSVVNCAGLFADRIESMVLGGEEEEKEAAAASNDVPRPNRQYFAKGNYYRLEGQRCPFSRLIYPVPRGGGLGVHLTFDLGGNARFGPDVEWIDPSVADPDCIDLDVDPSRADYFYSEVRTYWPGLRDGSLQPDYAGIRPKLGHPDVIGGRPTSVTADFCIRGPADHGVPGFVSLTGMESPGLTSCLAVAEMAARMLEDG